MDNPFSLENKNILVTGGSSGIGRQCAITMSNLGANIILLARNEEKLEETFSRLESGKHLKYSQDITEYDCIEAIIKDSVERIGKISGFVHSAGLDMVLPLKNMKPSHYEKLFNVNVIAGFEFAKIISKKKYIHPGGGSFVLMASILALLGQPGRIGYASSKGALISGAKAIAQELIPQKIRVNCILPAMVETEMSREFFEIIGEESKKSVLEAHPLGLGSPDDVANACVFLLSEASKWMTGGNLILDGGYSLRR